MTNHKTTTDAQLATLRGDVQGWQGEFKFMGGCVDDGGIMRIGALVYEPADSDRAMGTFVIGDLMDDHVGESLARMLNAVGPLLTRACLLEELVERSASMLESNSDKAARREWATVLRRDAARKPAP